MPNPSKVASNLKNVSIPHGVGFFFRRTGSSNFLDLGFLTDVSITPVAEFLDVTGNRKGINSVVKRILTNRSLTIDATLIEINVANMRLAFYGGATQTGSIRILETATVAKNGNIGGFWQLSEDAFDIISITSESGDINYTGQEVHPTDDDAFVGGGGTDLNALPDGSIVHVIYEVRDTLGPNSSDENNLFELLDTTTIEGEARFQIRNNQGGLAQIYELDNIQIAPNGASAISQEAVQSLPLTITAQEINSMFGRVYFNDIA